MSDEYGMPMLFSEGETIRLNRVPITANLISEGWIQDKLLDHPELLPVNEIEPFYSPLIPLGKEITNDVGYIDLMYINPFGNITIVETKLWRNQESRREVVGQILEYAKEIGKWDYDLLSKRIDLKQSASLYELARTRQNNESITESDFIDNVNRNLARGRFLLIICGDGIRENVKEMADFLQRTAHLHYTLALVETNIYETSIAGKSMRFVIPKLVTRTTEILRGIIKIEGSDVKSIKINMEDGKDKEEQETSSLGKRFRISEDSFFEELTEEAGAESVNVVRSLMNAFSEMGLIMEWYKTSFAVKLPDPSSMGTQISLVTFFNSGKLYSSLSESALVRIGLPGELVGEYYSKMAELFGREVVKCESGWYSMNKYITIMEVKEKYDEFIDIIADMADKIRIPFQE